MRVDDFTFEHRPWSDLPTGDVYSWLEEFHGDDQWVFDGEDFKQAVVVLGDHIIIWQDEPLSNDDKECALGELENSLGLEEAHDADGSSLDNLEGRRDSLASREATNWQREGF